jgi:hypothetical protein
MLVTELYHGQGLGNQLFAYVVTRMLAEYHGYDYGIMGRENLGDPRHNDKGLYFIDLDLGKEVTGGISVPGGPPDALPDGIENYYREYRHGAHTDDQLHTDIRLTDKGLFDLKPNTKIDGNLQSEDYFCGNLDKIKEWLKVKEEYDHMDTNGENICVMNFRGGDMVGNSGGFVPRSYWDNAIKRMVEYNPKMEFCIVTDDVETANKMLPEYPAYHRDVAWDYCAIKNARHVIASTSTFSCFPLWTSETLEYCIAPKHWFHHNLSQGWWSLGCCIYSFVSKYMDRNGKLFTVEECEKEFKEYLTEFPDLYNGEDADYLEGVKYYVKN